MIRLLIDSSQVLKKILHACANRSEAIPVDHEGKVVMVGNHAEAYEIFIKQFKNTLEKFGLTPCHTILVKDGKSCKDMRRQIYSEYCIRPKGPKEFMTEFYKLQDMVEDLILLYGGMSVSKDGVEADDILFHLAEVEDCVVWSGDGDLLACRGIIYDGNDINPDKFFGIDRKYIKVYKALVGDASDRIPGCKGFGKKTFIKMLETFGYEALDDLLGMLEEEALDELEDHIESFKPFQNVLEQKEEVYASYECAKFYHPGWDLEWKQKYPEGNGVFPEWEPEQVLVTADNYKDIFYMVKSDLEDSPFNSYDIETYTTEKGRDWSKRNKSKTKKEGPLDAFGQVMTGFSLTCGVNNHRTYYFCLEHANTPNLTRAQARDILNLLPEKKPLAVHHSIMEIPVTKRHFELRFDRGYLPENTYDTRILARDMDENEPSGLKHWSKLIMDYNQTTYEEVIGDKSGMNELSGEEVLAYGADDTICTSALLSRALIVLKYEGIWDAYLEVDQKAQFMFAKAFLDGVRFDMDVVKKLQDENNIMLKEITCNIEAFLEELRWEEKVQVNKPTGHKITSIEDLIKAKNLAKEAVDSPEYETIVHRWPGCEFVPAKKLIPSEIKRLYTIYTGGSVLDSRARKIEKLAEAISAEGLEDFAALVKGGELDKLNDLVSEAFEPSPELNLNSSKQLASLLYDALGYPVRVYSKLTETQRAEGRKQGNPAANELAFKYAIIFDAETEEEKVFLQNILDAKSCITEDSLFFTPYQQMPNPIDGMVHSQPGQAMAVTGRQTPSGPNIAQVSKKSKIRTAYIPLKKDHVWVSFDWSSQELCIIAENTQDENMLSCFTGDTRKDLHSMTGYGIWNLNNEPELNYDEFVAIRKNAEHKLHSLVKKCRNQAKVVNFLKAYLGTAASLALKLMLTEEEAQRMLDAADELFPRYPEWQEKMTEIHKERGYALTALGHRRRGRLTGGREDGHILRGLINHIIQGTAGEMAKRVMSQLWAADIFSMFDCYFLFPVHDEVNWSVHKDDVLEFIKFTHPYMTQKFADFSVEFKSSIEIGKNFGSLIELGEEIDEEAIVNLVASL